jgi:hypothetical protein
MVFKSMRGIESQAIQYSKGGTAVLPAWGGVRGEARFPPTHIFSIHYRIYLGFITGIIQIFPSPKCANISYYFLPGFCIFDLKCNLHAYLEKDRDWNRFTKI